MEKSKVLVGYYRGWSTKTPAEKKKAYQEEAGDDYREVEALLKSHAGVKKCHSREVSATEEMIHDLQGIFCKGRYRSWILSQRGQNAGRR